MIQRRTVVIILMKERVQRESSPRTQYSAKTKPRKHNVVFPSVTSPFILGPSPLGNKSCGRRHSDLLNYSLFGCLFSSFNHVANVSLISNTCTNQTHTVCDEAKKTNRNSPFLAIWHILISYFISSHGATFNRIYYFVLRENKAL